MTGVVTDGSDTKLGTGGMRDQSATNFEEDTAMVAGVRMVYETD